MSVRTCPKCKHGKSKVYDVRDRNGGVTIRSRKCPECGRKWQTVELERWRYEITVRGAEVMTKDAKFGKWIYYTNDESKARWKCSNCGKICHRDPHDKNYCSRCGSKNMKEA